VGNSQEEFSADLVIEARWVVPVNPPGVVLADHAVAVKHGAIVAVLPLAEMRKRCTAREVCQLPAHALIPGLINLHGHAAMTLMRGLADDLPLKEWLSGHIWPAEAKHISAQFVYDGTLLACAEMLRAGITCFSDMYFFPSMAGRAAIEAGMRAALGIVVVEFPTSYATDAHDYLRKGLAMRDELKHDPLMSFTMAPHAPYTVSDRSFEQILTLSEQLEIPIHCHLHETLDEIAESEAQFGMRPLLRLDRLGLLGPAFTAVHAVHLEPMEIELLARNGCNVAHCPTSNLKLASGIAPVARMISAGINVGLGTDGAASNNRLDILNEIRLATLLAKAQAGDAQVVPAHQALRMATLNAAEALGLGKITGSIEPGKSADLCAVCMDSIEMSPCYDPVSHLAYVAGREDVSQVWVHGRLLVDGRQLVHLDSIALSRKAEEWRTRISSGI
jgi:5-methylthioadenosine/S-adenosylhomocysteine deaminase